MLGVTGKKVSVLVPPYLVTPPMGHLERVGFIQKKIPQLLLFD
jgi:hypothetical protein